MDKKEIFHNMTKGTWIVAGGRYLSITQPDGLIDMAEFVSDADWNVSEYRSNRAAIVTAVNLWRDLMSKGINPDAEAVELLLSAVRNRAAFLSRKYLKGQRLSRNEKGDLSYAKQALDAAKL